MMYPYMTLNDDTEITHSEIHDDGVFKRRRVCECLKSLESDSILYISGREKEKNFVTEDIPYQIYVGTSSRDTELIKIEV